MKLQKRLDSKQVFSLWVEEQLCRVSENEL